MRGVVQGALEEAYDMGTGTWVLNRKGGKACTENDATAGL